MRNPKCKQFRQQHEREMAGNGEVDSVEMGKGFGVGAREREPGQEGGVKLCCM